MSAVASTATGNKRPIHIGFLTVPNYTMITFANAIAVLRMANRQSGQNHYRWSTLTLDGSTVASSDGLELKPDGPAEGGDQIDILFVCGGYDIEKECNQQMLEVLCNFARKNIPLGALCTGTYLLAAAGLLDGYRCTIHWENEQSLRERFPKVQVSSNVFVIDRNRLTCSGGVSSIDLMLTLIAKIHGDQLVQEITEQFAYERVRTEKDAQRTPLSHLIGSSQPKLVESVALMEANIEEPLRLDEVAEYTGISRRQLERLFHKYLHCAPSRYYMALRLSRARLLLLQTDMPIIEVAISCGFTTAPHFSKRYSEQYGNPPRDERRTL